MKKYFLKYRIKVYVDEITNLKIIPHFVLSECVYFGQINAARGKEKEDRGEEKVNNETKKGH